MTPVTNHTKEADVIFHELKTNFMDYDPAYFIQNNLILDGQPFSVLNNGWKFMADVYRYIALEATRDNGKPVVLCKGRQIGGTVMAAALDLYFMTSGMFSQPPIRVAHLFPRGELKKKFVTDKLASMIRTSKGDFINKRKLNVTNKEAVDNQTMIQFRNEETLFIEFCGHEGDRIRGMTVDVLFTDEAQEYSKNAINTTLKILTAAKYGPPGTGVQLFFGTPKDRNSFFYEIWEMSDKRYYQLGCTNCNEHFFFYDHADKESWLTIWSKDYSVKCPLCGREQTKISAIENGRWHPTKKTEDCKYIGFHLNQLYLPTLPKSKIVSMMPQNDPSQSERNWKNEVLGEFYEGAGLPLSRSDIFDYALDKDRGFSKVLDGTKEKVYLGVDWGGKSDGDPIDRGQSFSCVVILKENPGGVLTIEHAHKLRSQATSFRKETVVECFKRFGVSKAASDFYYGQDVNAELQVLFLDRFFPSQGSGNLIKPLKFREDEKIISYNKDLIVEEIFDKIKKGQIRFPGKNFEQVEWLVDHCVSMECNVRIVSGQQVKIYEKGKVQNDGLMALLYAYIAYKFEATKGFSVIPGFSKQEAFVRPTIAYVPRLKN